MLRKKKFLITGILFFIVSFLIIVFSGIRPMLFPTQEDRSPDQYGSGQIINNYILKQPFFLKKDYLTGVEVLFTNPSKLHDLINMMMILDENNNILYSQKFSSDDITNPVYYPFRFNKKVKIGNGHECFLVIYSINGDQHGSISVGLAPLKQFTTLTAIPVQNNDVISSLKNPGQAIDKSICFRTFETNYNFFSGTQILLWLIIIIVTLAIVFFSRIRTWMSGVRISLGRCYLACGSVFGLCLVFIVPPFQVPDENRHFFRSYQVAEFNFFQFNNTIPVSLTTFYDKFSIMDFRPYEKTSFREIRSASTIRLEPSDRITIDVPGLVLPFVPQAAGIIIGRIFKLPPLWLFYLGRITNLIIAVFLVYLSIKTTPILKWIFLLIALMPMTAYLFSSLSYDVLTISLSFLFTAICFNLAFSASEKISKKDILRLFLIAFFLALCKPPYYILAALFLLIPVKKTGSLKKYLVLFFALAIMVFAASKATGIKSLFGSSQEQVEAGKVLSIPASPSNGLTEMTQQPDNFDQPKTRSVVNMERQEQFILENPLKYCQIMLSAVFIYWRSFYLETFIGTLGWLDLPLPRWLSYSYLLILILTALGIADPGINLETRRRLTGLGVFIAGVVLVETAMYVVWSPVGFPNIEGVQGRYFIPLAPLFFLVLINRRLNDWLKNMKFSSVKTESSKSGKIKKTKKEYTLIGPVVVDLVPVIILCFVMLSLVTVVYEILNRFFIILI